MATQTDTSGDGITLDGLEAGLAVTEHLELVRLLGRGGMGSVWLAHDAKLDRDVAVKFISKALSNSETIKRFQREARISAKVDHPHVVQVFDYGVLNDETPYLVMELLKGESLDDRLDREGRLSVHETTLLVEQVAQALDAAHERGIIHRDIKPANLFLVESGYEIFVKIVDFGIAKPENGAIDGTAMTMTGMLIGTPCYMSPEQLFEAAPATRRSDLWALAVVAYETLTGSLPFEAETVAALGRVLAKGKFIPPTQHDEGLPAAFDGFFQRVFALEPGKRFETSDAFAQAFADAAGDGGVPSGRVSLRNAGEAGAETIAHANTVASRRAGAANKRRTPSRKRRSSSGEALESSGTRMGKYQLVAELGHGGMADVFLAVVHEDDFGVNKLLVVKRLRPNLAEDHEFVDMIIDEARLAARLNHPNVVQTLEAGKAGKHYFIAMEYLEGQPLHRVLSRAHRERGGIPATLAYFTLSEMLAGLHYAHELADYDGEPLGVVHRDVSPHNVFVTYDGRVKVMDFGIAKAAGRATYTATGVVKGKVSYMAPEQARSGELDRRVDIFAAGILLWEMAVGQRLWADTDELVVMNKLTSGDFDPSPRIVDPEVPEAIDAICKRALSFDPNERYATAAQMQADLDDAIAGLSAQAPEPRATARELGRYVADLFTEDRRELEAQIEAQMMAIEQGAGPVALRLGTPDPAAEAERTSAGSGRRSPETETALTTSAVRRPSPSRRTLLAFAAAATVAAVGYGLWSRTSSSPATTPTSERDVAATSEPTTEAAATVRLHIDVEPKTATLTLDDHRLETNPFTGERPRDDAVHALVIEAEGYQRETRALRLDRDASLTISLRKKATAEPTAEPARPLPRPVPGPLPKTGPEPIIGVGKPLPKPVRPVDETDPWGQAEP